MLSVGRAAPAFRLPGSDGETIEEYQLAEFTAEGVVVLLFYPFDFSPVCTEELCEFRDSEWLTITPDVDVVGVSTDSAFDHRQFIQQNNLPFPLVSDHDGRVSDAYDVLYDELQGHPQVSKRAVFVIDDSEIIRYAWEADDWKTDPDIEAINQSISEMTSSAP